MCAKNRPLSEGRVLSNGLREVLKLTDLTLILILQSDHGFRMAQTATIQISNSAIPLPADWGREFNGQKASITKIDDVLVVTPMRGSPETYSDEDIRAWLKEDALDDPTKQKLNAIMQNA